MIFTAAGLDFLEIYLTHAHANTNCIQFIHSTMYITHCSFKRRQKKYQQTNGKKNYNKNK